jgi:hypothetical protein
VSIRDAPPSNTHRRIARSPQAQGPRRTSCPTARWCRQQSRRCGETFDDDDVGQAKPDAKKKKRKQPDKHAVVDPDAFSVPEFCRRNGISLAMFYKRPDLMPATFSVGKRRLVSKESAARWRAEREAAAANA